jgi:tRNA G10  N-methylase Trm11
MNKPQNDIDYALLEVTRPPIYTAMKYWGKKPHNIWSEYIRNYTPENGIFLDPFCGSGISIIESLKLGRKTIGFDLNPLSSFVIDVYLSEFNFEKFNQAAKLIINKVSQDQIFQKIYLYNDEQIHHFKWDVDKSNEDFIYEVGIIDKPINKRELKRLRKPLDIDNEVFRFSESIDLRAMGLYFPDEEFHKSPSFSASFIKAVGGNNFSNIWTKRNLYVLALIFKNICDSDVNEDLKKQLLFGFIQTVHLCSKMNVPRNSAANRPFSTSWGRSAYLCAARKMEQNPLYVFEGSCFGKQSVESCLKHAAKYFKKPRNVKNVSESLKKKNDTSFDLKYGAVDINTIDEYIPEESVDFIITDPPYGGLVQYLDLSYLWLSWLKNYDPTYIPKFESEITIKKEIFDQHTYQVRFVGALKKIHKVLKKNGKLVLTFHNQEIKVWNSFLFAIKESGFIIEKNIHQQNMRSGESVVANPYGTSGTDFYIRCVKSNSNQNKESSENLDTSILNAAIRVISERNEPTPYQILFNGILAHLSSTGNLIDDFDNTIQKSLKKYVDNIFILSSNNDSKAGNYWWFKNPREYINFPDIPLSQRVELAVLSILRKNSSVSLDDVLKKIFINFPNGLTPDRKSIGVYLEKYAVKSSEKWHYKASEFEESYTKHTEYLKKLALIGKRLGFEIFIGRREQPEKIDDKKLADYADYIRLDNFLADKHKKSRLEMIDMIWIAENNFKYLIEVENSTTITSAIQRGSNANKDIPKLIVIPDLRESELRRIKDKFFIDGFKEYSWKYMIYSDVDKILSSKQNIQMFLKEI